MIEKGLRGCASCSCTTALQHGFGHIPIQKRGRSDAHVLIPLCVCIVEVSLVRGDA